MSKLSENTSDSKQAKELGIYEYETVRIQSRRACVLEDIFDKGVIRFDVREKLSLRYISLFEILERVGEVAGLALLPSLEGVHNVFHMSQLRRYVRDESYALDHSELELQLDLSYT